MKIKADQTIKEILENYPETFSVFTANGFGEESSQDLTDKLGEGLLLKTALRVIGINQELFIRQLEEKIADKAVLNKEKNSSDIFYLLQQTSEPEAVNQKVNFIGFTYCPLKHTFREAFQEVYQTYVAESADREFKFYVPSGCGGGDPFEDLWKVDDIAQLPEIIASVGFGDFFRKEFVDKFVTKGYFKSVDSTKKNKDFVDAGFIDPDGWYTIYSVFPLVMLIDKRRLGKLPVPTQWSDLLSPIYENNIIIGASHGEMHEDLLLYIHKDYGDEGLTKLAANIKNGWHASQMAKTAGTNNTEGAAIYVIPWMFAKSCPRTETTAIIWPADGALTTPNYVLAKKESIAKYKQFIDFITGVNYGKKSADNYFPVMNSEVDNRLPEGAGFKWLGWDYIKSVSMDKLKEHVLEVFYRHWDKKINLKEMA